MKKQLLLFDNKENKEEKKYTQKIDTPTYEPKNIKPHILELCDTTKTKKLIRQINASNLCDNEKEFLRFAAQRHIVFNYEKIADYYAQSNSEIQTLMESSALVIIDFDSAIENGYVNLCKKIKEEYFEEYNVDEN